MSIAGNIRDPSRSIHQGQRMVGQGTKDDTSFELSHCTNYLNVRKLIFLANAFIGFIAKNASVGNILKEMHMLKSQECVRANMGKQKVLVAKEVTN